MDLAQGGVSGIAAQGGSLEEGCGLAGILFDAVAVLVKQAFTDHRTDVAGSNAFVVDDVGCNVVAAFLGKVAIGADGHAGWQLGDVLKRQVTFDIGQITGHGKLAGAATEALLFAGKGGGKRGKQAGGDGAQCQKSLCCTPRVLMNLPVSKAGSSLWIPAGCGRPGFVACFHIHQSLHAVKGWLVVRPGSGQQSHDAAAGRDLPKAGGAICPRSSGNEGWENACRLVLGILLVFWCRPQYSPRNDQGPVLGVGIQANQHAGYFFRLPQSLFASAPSNPPRQRTMQWRSAHNRR